MLFGMIPLAFALSILLSYIPDFHARLARGMQRILHGIGTLFRRTAGEEAVHWAPAAFLLLTAALFCLAGGGLDAVHPLLPALLIAPLLPLSDVIRAALDVREALEAGECTTEAEREAYEQRIMDAVGTLASRCARELFAPLLAATLLLPAGLAPAVFGTLYALRQLDGAWAWAKKANAAIVRFGEAVMIACVIPTAALCGTEMGMAARACRQGVKNVLLSAVGIDPARRSGHRPVTGDISQSCLCVCVALGLMYAVLAAAMVVIGACILQTQK